MLNVSSKMYIFNDEDTSLITKEATDKGILNVINDIKKSKKNTTHQFMASSVFYLFSPLKLRKYDQFFRDIDKIF